MSAPGRRAARWAAFCAAGMVVLGVAGPPLGGAPEPARTALARLQSVPLQSADPAVELVNDEVATATLDPTGLPERALLISRLTGTGEPREVVDPASQANVRYLDRLGRPATSPDGVLLTVGGNRPTALTQARFDKPLPLALHVEYALDGQVVPADDVPGSSGDVGVRYTLTNTTVQQVDLAYVDAAGAARTSRRPVFAPFQGTLTVTLPTGSQLVEAPGAVLTTDLSGRTVARWRLALHPPIDPPIQQMGLTLRTQEAGIPGAEVLLVPVTSEQDPAGGFSADLLTATTEGNGELYRGLAALDDAAAALASGSGALAGGLTNLAGGADAVAAASDTLAEGIGGLSAGADQVAEGNEDLAVALGRAASGATDLAAATEQLATASSPAPSDALAPLQDAGDRIEAGLNAAAARIGGPADPVLGITDPLAPDADDTCPPGGAAPPDDDCVTLYQGVRALRDGLLAVNARADALEARADRIRAGLKDLAGRIESIGNVAGGAARGAAEVHASLCLPAPTIDPAACEKLAAVAEAAADASGQAGGTAPGLADLVAALRALDAQATAAARAIDDALAATERLLLGVEAVGQAVGPGTPSQPGLATGMAALNAGLDRVSAALTQGQQELVAALAQVSAGSAELATGIDAAATGADALAGGAAALADGADQAATGASRVAGGSSRVADGTDAAADAGEAVAGGAAQLADEGTGPAASGVLEASTDPAEAQAWLAAADARAADALPYGAPEGAVGRAAYVFTLAEVPAPRGLWDRIRGMLGG